MTMNDQQLLRYSRHILLPAVDIAGQEALLAATVLVVGLGGLGCPVALYLAAAGVGHLVLVDDDSVDLSNLQRQIAHTQADIGRLKVDSAAQSIQALNPDTKITCLTQRLDGSDNPNLPDIDLIVDASDSFKSRYSVNALSLKLNVPLVSAAAIAMQGQLAVFNRNAASPCYECLYPRRDGQEELGCNEAGVLSALVGVMGSMQALETLKLIIGGAAQADGLLTVFDATTLEWQRLNIPKRPECEACSDGRSS